MDYEIKLIHGDGGYYTSLLIKEIFYPNFNNELLINSLDSSLFEVDSCKLAFTTDTFVVKPLFFPGGDIGKLSVCGTINDLVVAGAKPLYLSCGFVIEEGFKTGSLKRIVKSMKNICEATGVKIITGDTKVVEKGSLDGLIINTSGIGVLKQGFEQKSIQPGDKIIITGGIGEHGTSIAVERYDLKLYGTILSDCMPLNKISEKLEKYSKSIKLMKDPTRGGVGTALNEIAEFAGLGIQIEEKKIPIKKEVLSINQILGLDPMYMACEGRMLLVVDEKEVTDVVEEIRNCEGCDYTNIIGSFVEDNKLSRVVMETHIGGRRIIRPLEEEMLPRIC